MFNTPFRHKPFLITVLLWCVLGTSLPLAFSADYDLATLKTVLVKLHLRYEESVKTNVQLTQQVQQLKAQLKASPQVTSSDYT